MGTALDRGQDLTEEQGMEEERNEPGGHLKEKHSSQRKAQDGSLHGGRLWGEMFACAKWKPKRPMQLEPQVIVLEKWYLGK